MIISVDTSKRYQTIESFGVSGAWWAQLVGGFKDIDKQSGIPIRERIAELLFSDEKGIGITCYRYNLGGGSKNSGSCSFSQGCRAAQSFDISDTEYDFTRDKNAVWMMKEAVKNGVDELVLFSNSPPERYTKNHKACLDTPWLTNLAKKNEPKFVKYLLDCTEHFVGEGLPVKYISPINEPLWVWTERHGQEGCHYNPTGARRLLHCLCAEIEKRPALRGVKVSGAENGDIRWFNKTYCRVLLNDEVIRRNIDAVDTHSYFLSAPFGFMNDRLAYLKRYRKWMDRHYPAVPLKTSEWTHMQGGRDRGIDSAIVQAKVMSEDISILCVSSWQHWVAVSDVDYCDGLIYINPDRSYEMTKRYYAFGNFTKFIKRGSVRVECSCDDSEITALAFVKGDEAVVVLINPTEKDKPLSLPESAKLYVTDKDSDLALMPNTVLPSRSVCTAVCKTGEISN